MARGAQQTMEDLDLYLMKITGLKPGDKIHMSQVKPKGEKKEGQKMEYETLEDVYDVSGNIFRAKLREYEYEGTKKYDIQLYLKDAEAKELVILSCGVNGIGRKIINKLLNLDGPKGGVLKISVFNDKKDDNRPKVAVKYDGNKVEAKYSKEETAKYVTETPVRKQGKTVIERDYYDLDQFLIKEFKEKFCTQYDAAPATTNAPKPPEEAFVDEKTGLPF